MLTDINDIIELSTKVHDSDEYNCNIVLKVDDNEYNAYAVNIAHRELGFCTDKGYVTYDVNGNGLNNYMLLIDIEE